MTASRAVAAAAALAALACAAPAAARESGRSELDARGTFVLRGIEDADGVSAVGDVDGDGHADVAVWREDDDEARIVLGGERVPGLRSFRVAGVQGEETRSIVGVGDVTGDGLDDMAASYGYGDGVAIIAGRRDPRDVNLRRPEQRSTTFAGGPVSHGAGAGDVNGDGTDDLLVAGSSEGGGGDDEDEFEVSEVGEAWVVFGGPAMTGRRDLRNLGAGGFKIVGGGDDGAIAHSAAPAGDVDGDGLGDVVLGAPFAGLVARSESRQMVAVSGAAFIVYGRRETTTVDLSRPSPQATRIDGGSTGFLGYAVTGPGDVDGDGLADVALSAPVHPVLGPANETVRGDAFVVLGRRERRQTHDVEAPAGAGYRITGVAGGDATGLSLAPGGDVDGDGLADFLLGAPGIPQSSSEAIAGAAHVVYGTREPADLALASPGDRALTLRGTSVERAGTAVAAGTDLDADGQREILVSRPGACRIARIGEGDVVAVELGAPPSPPPGGLGTPGPDRIEGGPVGDSLLGFDAADDVSGRDGHDCVSGGEGDDVLSGGLSGDAIFGELGADRIAGDAGCDRIIGGAGNDVIVAGPNRLPIEVRLQAPIGARDRDEVDAGDGNDRVTGGVDSDRISGGAGNDRLTAGVGDDAMEGGVGRDRLIGNQGSDYMVGGTGTDVIRGGPGRDFLGGDVDLGFDFDEALFGDRPRRYAGDDDIAGGGGDDMMHGEGGRDRLDGGSGDDRAQGMRGNDRLIGRGGRDALQGGPGDDRASGGSARDEIVGGSGDDVLSGGSFGDLIDAGYGRDRVFGGSGPDRIDVRDKDRDVVRCGRGRDRVTTDRRDVVRGCEVVNGRPR